MKQGIELLLAKEVEEYFEVKISGSSILAKHGILPWEDVRDIDVFVTDQSMGVVTKFFENRGYECKKYHKNYGDTKGYLCKKPDHLDIHIVVVQNLNDVKTNVADIVLCKLAIMLNDWGYESEDYFEQLRRASEPEADYQSWVKMRNILKRLRNGVEAEG